MSKLEETFTDIRKDYGQGSISRLGDNPLEAVPVISTGSFEIDHALGVGGLPVGRIVELYGPESAGKTTVALHVCAQAQIMGLDVAFIDVEHAFDPTYAATIGVNIDRLIFCQPSSAEEALEIVDRLIRSESVGLIVVDSVAALTPRAEMEGDMGDSHMGLQARLMGQALRKITGNASKNGTCVIFINQIREKIGVMFGSPETTPGGRALKFYASVRLDVRRKGQLKHGTEVVGNDTIVKVVKNKVAAPFKVAEIVINYGEGIDVRMSLLKAGVDRGVLVTKGSHWYDWDGEKFAASKTDAKQYTIDHPEFFNELNARVRKVVE
jgi:recombination protein RecA